MHIISQDAVLIDITKFSMKDHKSQILITSPCNLYAHFAYFFPSHKVFPYIRVEKATLLFREWCFLKKKTNIPKLTNNLKII